MTENDELNEALADMVKAVEKKIRNTCRADSDKPMPELAQKIHGREFYQCGREKNHEGKHRWPGHGHNTIVEWGDDESFLTSHLPGGMDEGPNPLIKDGE